MNIDQILKENEAILITESASDIRKAIKNIVKMPWKTLKKYMQKQFAEFSTLAIQYGVEKEALEIINKFVNGNYRHLRDISSQGIKESRLNEGHWWDTAKDSMFGASAFYPLLQAFLELDKLVKGTGDVSVKYVAIYALIWVGIISGKVLKDSLSGMKKASREYKIVNKAYMEMK